MLDNLNSLLDRLIVDVLSDAIAAMRTGRPSSNRGTVNSPWCYRLDAYDGAGFHVLLRGSGWMIPDGGRPIAMAAGDVALLPYGSAHVLSSSRTPRHPVPLGPSVTDPNGDTDFLCGKYRFDHTRTHPLLAQLPEVVHVPAQLGRHPELRAAIDLLAAELSGTRAGEDAVVSGLLDLLLVYVVRTWLDEHAEQGWPRALHDREIAAALTALHSDPAAPWRIEDLAAHVGLSRATLARRFTALIGQPPMTYLTWWRLTTAARLLRRTDLALPAIANEVGYGSPFAFSHAFKRHFGRTPGHYRTETVSD